MGTMLAMFRGINVGGNNQVKMADLKLLHASLGLQDVTTYIQTGNVLFTSDAADTALLAHRIEDAFAEKFGFRASVIVRTASELQAVVEQSPFQDQPDKEPQWIVVMFLATCPDKAAQEDLRQSYGGPEEMHFIGQELYMYYPEGIGRSKLTITLIEKKLKTSGTARNWNTVMKLHELVQH